jgi:hypothetical protein
MFRVYVFSTEHLQVSRLAMFVTEQTNEKPHKTIIFRLQSRARCLKARKDRRPRVLCGAALGCLPQRLSGFPAVGSQGTKVAAINSKP